MYLDLARFREHAARVRASVLNTRTLADIPDWICDNTYLRGEKFSFKDHEFQETILRDESIEVNTAKCSQIGLSECMARWVLAVCYNYPEFSAIITFPFGGDANNFAKTRVDPIIENSPLLKKGVDPGLDNSDHKRILQSLVYFRGTNGKTQAISIPADVIVSDEIDRSSPHTLTQYTSRLTHSVYKWRRNFSTPTVRGYGIDLLMQSSRRFSNLCKCNHCATWFKPDFYEHVKIPNFDGHLDELNKHTLAKTRFLEAKLLCPTCGNEPSLLPLHRQYVQENVTDNHDAAGYYVSPFDAPKIITPVDLLRAMVNYARRSEFKNQNLGITAEDYSESLVVGDIIRAVTMTDLRSSAVHAMGCDMGLICHIAIGRMTAEGQLLIVHREKVPLGIFEERKRTLAREYRVGITVCDSQPYVDTILRMQKYDKNLFGGVFHNSKNIAAFQIKMIDEEAQAGKLPIHQALINRNLALDELMGMFLASRETNSDPRMEIVIQQQDDELEEEYQKHFLDMKRVQIYDQNQELTYSWEKSPSGVDHWHFTTLYLLTACRLRSTIYREGMTLGSAMLFSTFKTQLKSLPGPKSAADLFAGLRR